MCRKEIENYPKYIKNQNQIISKKHQQYSVVREKYHQ